MTTIIVCIVIMQKSVTQIEYVVERGTVRAELRVVIHISLHQIEIKSHIER